MKRFPLFLLFSLVPVSHVQAMPAADESASLSLLLSQLAMLESTLHRAESQASVAPTGRFFFDYPQAYADIRAIRAGTEHYLAPTRAQPRAILPLTSQYRQEDDAE